VDADDRGASVDLDVDGTIGTRVTRNWLVAAVRVVLSQLIAGSVFLVLSHELAPREYALYAVAAIVAPMAYSLIATPVGLVLIRRTGALDRRSIDAAFTFLCGYALACALLVAVPVGTSRVVEPVVAAVGAAYVMSLVLAFPAYVVLQRNLRSAHTSVIELADRVAFQLTVMVVVVAGVGVTGAIATGLAAAGVVTIALSYSFVRWRPRWASPRWIRDELVESTHPFLVVGTSLLAEGAVVPLLGAVAGGVQAGLYGWALGILAIPTGFVHAATSTLYPAFVRVADDVVDDALHRATRLVSGMATFLAAIVAAALPSLVGTVFPTTWQDAVPAAWILLLALMLYASTVVANTFWNARLSLRTFAAWQVASTVVLFALAVPFGAAWGALGAAAAYAAGRFVLAVLLVEGMRRRTGVRLHGSVVANCLAAAAAAAVGLGVDRAMPDGWLQLACVVGATALAALVALEAITRGHLRRDGLEAWRMLRSPLSGTAEADPISGP
jgi:O-antigen/teichoic acid export membrane protein